MAVQTHDFGCQKRRLNREGNMKRLFTSLLALGLLLGCQEDIITTESNDLGRLDDSSAKSSVKLTVMTRNMYIGANVDRIIEEQNTLQIPIRVAEAWQTLHETDFPSRARAMAQEIADARPHLVGLQEVTLIRTQEEADFQLNAETIAFDFLADLMTELDILGLDYRIAGQIENSDVELPRYDPGVGFSEVRITVIIPPWRSWRKGIPFSSSVT